MALIEITLTIDGQAGPFDLFSNVDNYVQAFDTQVPAASLTAGYIVVAPAGTSIVRVCSTGVCTNCVDIPTNCPTTTTTTSSSTSTTTSTSTSTSTTTTVYVSGQVAEENIKAVSYTHLTLPTICSV